MAMSTLSSVRWQHHVLAKETLKRQKKMQLTKLTSSVEKKRGVGNCETPRPRPLMSAVPQPLTSNSRD